VLLVGWRPLVVGYRPIAMLAGSIGIWLVYVQHQFESTYWRHEPEWSFERAAFKGCSFYDLPGVLRWLTGHIGFHHIYHLAINVPSYRLRAAYEAIPAFCQARRLGLRDSFWCWRLAVWDEQRSHNLSLHCPDPLLVFSCMWITVARGTESRSSSA
jgi:omega-6 fatty acid desaturase (delta-12 desaturase)